MKTLCQCKAAGLCPRHLKEKTPAEVRQCQSDWHHYHYCERKTDNLQPGHITTGKRDPVTCDVIIPYHPATFEWVEESVNSILNQNCARPIIHLIADGFPTSEDALRFKFNDAPNVRKWRNKTAVGPFISTMRIFDHLETDIMLVQDSDDIAMPDRCWYTVACLEQTGREIFGASVQQFIDHKWSCPLVERIYHKSPTLTSGNINEANPGGNVVHPTMGIRKSTFEKLNGYTEALTAADTHLIRRAHEMGCSFFISPDVVALRRLHSKSLSHGKRIGFGSSELKAIHVTFETHYRQIAAGAKPEGFGALNQHRNSDQIERVK
ncbi:glycosyltransferase [Gimesia fumaroli]|uniref:Glycosyl transferase family 2 n=1 Tax=Gimesia fumaroli TaxID=2527976 RepID=A0A518I8U0_9PLAN|nr:glycosyltransferase [Gimesia fumaroli]QDV49525.1 Glycosyl transferase family 2 [Gimesia fumaroli]